MSWSGERTWPWWRTSVASRRYSVGVRTTASPSMVTSWWAKSTRTCRSSNEVDRLAAGYLAPADGLEPGQQLDPAEGFGQVVVGPGVEAPHLVELGGAGGEHEDRRVAHVPDALKHLPAVEIGQAHIEDHDVGDASGGTIRTPSRPVAGLGDDEALALEQGPEELPDVAVVFDDQDRDTALTHGIHRRSPSAIARPLYRAAGANLLMAIAEGSERCAGSPAIGLPRIPPTDGRRSQPAHLCLFPLSSRCSPAESVPLLRAPKRPSPPEDPI